MMSNTKKIVIGILILIATVGYVAVTSIIIESMRSTTTVAEPLTFGDYIVNDANGDLDPDDEDKTLYNSINSELLFNDDSTLNDYKLVHLYNIYLDDSVATPVTDQTIELEVSESFATDANIRIIRIDNNREINFVEMSVEQRTRNNDNGGSEAYSVLVFDISESGYYGVATQTAEATYSLPIFIGAITFIVVSYVVFFIILKPKDKKDYDNEVKGRLG